ncbi:MAG: hypothetical protein ACXWU1_10525 [Allosphingosinicella sp.]
MSRYRYRTNALAGPWRNSPDLALQDAARARQVRIAGEGENGVSWNVPGEIEVERGPERHRKAARPG